MLAWVDGNRYEPSTPTMTTQDPARPAVAAGPPANAPVGTLAAYRLLRSLGKGGMGEVFLALAPDGSTVALKAFLINDDDDGLVAQAFVREASVGHRLQHPDIVKVLDSGTQGRYAYLAMEFVPGHDLRAHTQPGRLLPLHTVLATVQRVARALAAAHELHVVHRDIKPANVLVDGPTDTVKVTDFGLARLGDAFRSRTGIIAGTPSYMSPEQLAEMSIGPRSDLYALGVLLFELLTGRLPHEGRSLGELLTQVANRPAPRVSTLRAGLPPALTQLVADLLEKRPERRPPDALTVADRLAAVQAALSPAEASGPKSRG